MYKLLLFATIFLSTLINANADGLSFPKTEKEIIKLLTEISDKTIITPHGETYVSKKGKVYKSINGNLFRMRGIKTYQAKPLLPKAGALVHFEIDSAEIKSDSFQILDEFGKALKNGLPNISIMIAGHTDSSGKVDYNLLLSQKRAQSVASYLVNNHGIESKRIAVKGFGMSEPIVANTTELNRSKNRRVEFIRID